MLIATSILSIQNDIPKIKEIDSTRTDYIHLDVMDGNFVKPVTSFLELPSFQKKLDVHFMVKDIKKYIDLYANLNPEYMTFHIEATDRVKELISYIKNKSIKVGISVSPDTDLDVLCPYLESIDLILVMSVYPGYGGQVFIKNSIERIKTLVKWREKNHYTYKIEVDGGIKLDNCIQCREADILVIGTEITDFIKPNEKVQEIKKTFYEN